MDTDVQRGLAFPDIKLLADDQKRDPTEMGVRLASAKTLANILPSSRIGGSISSDDKK
jgi:hypothetical protein